MNVHAGAEGVVDGVEEVGGEEDDALEIFELAEKDLRQFISEGICWVSK